MRLAKRPDKSFYVGVFVPHNIAPKYIKTPEEAILFLTHKQKDARAMILSKLPLDKRVSPAKSTWRCCEYKVPLDISLLGIYKLYRVRLYVTRKYSTISFDGQAELNFNAGSKTDLLLEVINKRININELKDMFMIHNKKLALRQSFLL